MGRYGRGTFSVLTPRWWNSFLGEAHLASSRKQFGNFARESPFYRLYVLLCKENLLKRVLLLFDYYPFAVSYTAAIGFFLLIWPVLLGTVDKGF